MIHIFYIYIHSISSQTLNDTYILHIYKYSIRHKIAKIEKQIPHHNLGEQGSPATADPIPMSATPSTTTSITIPLGKPKEEGP
jgi:hypothetical protein